MRRTNAHLSAVLLVVSLWSCNPDRAPDTPQQKPRQPAAPDTTQPSATAAAPAAICAERVKDFLGWYARRYERNDTTTLFINSPLLGDEDSTTLARMRGNISTTRYMQLNRRKLGAFIDTLKRSGYFSASYLAAKRTSIEHRGRTLEAARLDEGVPDGFDADEVLNTQDIYDLKDIDKLVTHTLPKLKPGTLAYRLPMSPDFSWYFYLKQENNRCVIDSLIAN